MLVELTLRYIVECENTKSITKELLAKLVTDKIQANDNKITVSDVAWYYVLGSDDESNN
jgi:hypothetical protein